MNKIKVNLDRKPVSSDYIESKQDFKHVTNQVLSSTTILKSTWFYGSIGLASLATIVTLSVKTTQNPLNEENTTLKNTITTASFLATSPTHSEQEVKKSKPQMKEQKTIEKAPIVEVEKNTVSNTSKPIIAEEKKVITIPTPEERPVISREAYIAPKKEVVKKSYMPKINGVYNGEIQISQLCNAGLEVNDEIEIVGFTLNYSTNRGDKALRVNGDRVPGEICSEMYSYGIDQMIFIMDIVGRNAEGELLRFVPMNLTAVIN